MTPRLPRLISLLVLPLLLVAGLVGQQPATVSFVEEVRIETVEALLGGRSFGEAGAYEKLTGSVVFAFDPAHPANAEVVDLGLAQRREDGLVEAVADLMILRPRKPPKGGGTALIEVSNRGGKAALRYFCRGRGGADPVDEADFGDAWLLRQGLTVVWLGWQADVPDRPGLLRLRVPVARAEDGGPLRGLVRADWTVDEAAASLPLAHRDHQAYPALEEGFAALTVRPGRLAPRTAIRRERWRFARVSAGGAEAPDRTWITLEGGFRPGGIYELVYEAEDPRVVGLGLAAMRDFAAWLKRDPDCPFPVERTVAVGISQTGRFLRHFLWQGFNAAADGLPAFDGVMVMTAGAGRGSFNHRFAQPSRDAHRYSAFFYPTDLFPFSSRVQRDEALAAADGLLARAEADGCLPKLFQVNSGYEYWGRAAALVHTAVAGGVDVEPHPAERLYHLRSTQHFPVGWPRALPTDAGPWLGSPIDNLAGYRALLAALLDWVEDGREPPPTRVPTLRSGTLVPLSGYAWPEVPGMPAPRVVHEAYRADYGPRWSQGVVDWQPPQLGMPFPSLVPQVDPCGIEIAGVPNLETEVPLGSFAPWHLRPPDGDGVRELTDFYGSFLPFPRDDATARQAGDPRPNLDALYSDQRDFLKRVEAALGALVGGRWLLPEDTARQREEALRRFRSLR